MVASSNPVPSLDGRLLAGAHCKQWAAIFHGKRKSDEEREGEPTHMCHILARGATAVRTYLLTCVCDHDAQAMPHP